MQDSACMMHSKQSQDFSTVLVHNQIPPGGRALLQSCVVKEQALND
jgi:hypothetical protein